MNEDIKIMNDLNILKKFIVEGNYKKVKELMDIFPEKDKGLLRELIKKYDAEGDFIENCLYTHNFTLAKLLKEQGASEKIALEVFLYYAIVDVDEHLSCLKFIIEELTSDLTFKDRSNRSIVSYCYDEKTPQQIRDLIKNNFAKQVKAWSEKELSMFLETAKTSHDLSGLDVVMFVQGKTSKVLNEFIKEIKNKPEYFFNYVEKHPELISPEWLKFLEAEIFNNITFDEIVTWLHMSDNPNPLIFELSKIPRIKDKVMAGDFTKKIQTMAILKIIAKDSKKITKEHYNMPILKIIAMDPDNFPNEFNQHIIKHISEKELNEYINGVMEVLDTTLVINLILNRKYEMLPLLNRRKELNVNEIDIFGNLPILMAITQSTFPALKMLLDPPFYADPNKPDGRGNLALIEAIRLNKFDYVKKLLEMGADTLKVDRSGISPRQAAKQYAAKHKSTKIMLLVEEYSQRALLKSLEDLLKKGSLSEAKKVIREYLRESPLPEKPVPEKRDWKGNEEQYKLLEAIAKEMLEEDEKRISVVVKNIQEILGKEYLKNLDDIPKQRIVEINDSIKKLFLPSADLNDFIKIEKYLVKHKINQVVKDLLSDFKKDIIYGNAYDILLKTWHDDPSKTVRDFLIKQDCLTDDYFLSFFKKAKDARFLPLFASVFYGADWTSKIYKIFKDKPNVLFDKKVDFETKSKFHDKSIFHCAIADGDLNFVKSFFDRMDDKAKILFFTKQHTPCPVADAVRSNKPEILEFFLKNGANPYYGCDGAATKTLLELAGDNVALINPIKEAIRNYTKKEVDNKVKKEGGNKVVNERQTELGKRVSHILGLGKIKLKRNTQQEHELSYQGSFSKNAIPWVMHALEKYNENVTETIFMKIESAFKLAQDVLVDNKKYTQDVIKDYQAGNLIVLPTQWVGHATCVVLKKVGTDTLLSFTNRGLGGDQAFGTKVYKVKAGADINHFIKKMLIDVCSIDGRLLKPEETRQFLESSLESVVDRDNPLDKLPQKGQKWGTCGVANRKGAILGAIYLLEYEKMLLGNDELLKSNPLSKDIKQNDELDKLKEKCKANSKLAYKNFTNFIRNEELDRLIEEIEHAKVGGEIDLSFYYDILVNIVLEHKEFDKKNNNQGKRILQIWDKLPAEYQAQIREQIKDFDDLKDAFIKKMGFLPHYQKTVTDKVASETALAAQAKDAIQAKGDNSVGPTKNSI